MTRTPFEPHDPDELPTAPPEQAPDLGLDDEPDPEPEPEPEPERDEVPERAQQEGDAGEPPD